MEVSKHNHLIYLTAVIPELMPAGCGEKEYFKMCSPAEEAFAEVRKQYEGITIYGHVTSSNILSGFGRTIADMTKGKELVYQKE